MSGTASPATAKEPRILAMLAALLAIFTAIFSSNLPTPLYAVWQQQMGFSATALTAVFAVYVFGVVSMLLTLGTLSDKIGRRQLLVPGILFITAGVVVFYLAKDIYWLGTARILTGIGTGIVTGAASAAVIELDPDNNWTRAATLSALFFTMGAFAGPTLSSLALAFGGGADSWPFLVTLVLCVLTIILLLTAPWPKGIGRRQKGFQFRDWRPTPVKVPRALLGAFMFSAAGICLAWSTGSLYASLGPSLARDLVGVSDRAMAGLFAAAWQLTAGISQFACQKQPLDRLILVGPPLLTAGLLCLALAVVTSSPVIFTLATLATAMGAGATGVVALASISQVAPPEERGGIISAFYLMAYLTMATVVLGVGFVSDLIGFGNTVIGFTILISIAAASLLLVAIKTRRTSVY